MFKKSSKALYVHLRARSWYHGPMKLLKWGRKMPSTKQYSLVPNDDFDTRVPMHPEEAFNYGISFQAKYIGSLDVPRPGSRVEIVAAMRRVRYEFKARGVKKRKVTVEISVDGVKVFPRFKNNKPKKKKKKSKKPAKEEVPEETDESEGLIMHHPIYRIFYVSHDSSDLKIFSYIARDGNTNSFKCNVFKSNKKSQAMRIVRTVGQAFEVCHKMQTDGDDEPNADVPAIASTAASVDDRGTSDCASDVQVYKGPSSACDGSESGAGTSKPPSELGAPGLLERPGHLELVPPLPRKDNNRADFVCIDMPEYTGKTDAEAGADDALSPLAAQHQLQLLRGRLEQQAQQTRAAVAQLLLLRDQLAAEQAARCEAQARTHQLLVHNKELLEHISALVSHLQERDAPRPISTQQVTLLPQKSKGRDVQNGNQTSLTQQQQTKKLIDSVQHKTKNQNIENNNIPGQFPVTFDRENNLNFVPKPRPRVDYTKHYFQNSNAFPNIPLLKNGPEEISTDSMTTMSTLGFSESSQEALSSDESPPFIKPLSAKGTLKTKAKDGRTKLIVPISPSASATEVPQPAPGAAPAVPPRAGPSGPVLRTTSEKVSNKSEMMSALRAQWTRHTSK